jgi:hypothetical protein
MRDGSVFEGTWDEIVHALRDARDAGRPLDEYMAAEARRFYGATGKQVMEKFGVRPLVKSMSSIRQGPMEFLLAAQTFMTKWAEQYATQIETTFMPEIFPGMRVNLVGHNLQVYVTEVTHSGDFESGFTTSMTIMAPSSPTLRQMATSAFNATAEELAAGMQLFRNAAEVAT